MLRDDNRENESYMLPFSSALFTTPAGGVLNFSKRRRRWKRTTKGGTGYQRDRSFSIRRFSDILENLNKSSHVLFHCQFISRLQYVTCPEEISMLGQNSRDIDRQRLECRLWPACKICVRTLRYTRQPGPSSPEQTVVTAYRITCASQEQRLELREQKDIVSWP